MKVLWIILLASFVWIFTKFEVHGLDEIDFFPLHEWTMAWPVYMYNICLSIVPACFVWSYVDLMPHRRRELKLMAWLVSSRLPWFLLTANRTFFRFKIDGVGVMPIGYDALMFILLGLVVLKATINE